MIWFRTHFVRCQFSCCRAATSQLRQDWGHWAQSWPFPRAHSSAWLGVLRVPLSNSRVSSVLRPPALDQTTRDHLFRLFDTGLLCFTSICLPGFLLAYTHLWACLLLNYCPFVYNTPAYLSSTETNIPSSDAQGHFHSRLSKMWVFLEPMSAGGNEVS